MAVVGDPAALRELVAMPVDRFRWRHKFNVLGFVGGKESIVVSDGADHARRRASVQAAFSRRRLNGWIPTIVERTDRMIGGLVGTSPVRNARSICIRLGGHWCSTSPCERCSAAVSPNNCPISVVLSAHLAGRDPRAWVEPLRFDPDRFLAPSDGQKALADVAWVPFGRGARYCIGFALAQWNSH